MTTLDFTPTLLTADSSAPIAVVEPDGLRLRLRDPGSVGGFVDGGWWPRTLDLGVELAPLLTEIWSVGYDVRRVTYNLTAWNHAPRRIAAAGRLVRIGGYHTQDEDVVSLVDSSGWKRIDLVVVPPDTDPVVAERALALAGLDGDRHRAAEILRPADQTASAGLSRTRSLDDLPPSGWETDGGRVLAS